MTPWAGNATGPALSLTDKRNFPQSIPNVNEMNTAQKFSILQSIYKEGPIYRDKIQLLDSIQQEYRL